MATKAEYPYDEYTLYVVYHKKMGRMMAQLVSKTHRTTLSYARYIYSINCGRILSKEEHVDHIDNDRTNDKFENLQILTFDENRAKQKVFYKPKTSQRICPVCNNTFTFSERYAKFLPNPTCSRSCGGKKAI